MSRKPVYLLAAVLVLMAAVSVLLLLVLTLLTWKGILPAGWAKLAVKAVYVIACLAGGIFMGKSRKEKKFLWGIAAGGMYFAVLTALSLAFGGKTDASELLAALAMTLPAGMLGGMIS